MAQSCMTGKVLKIDLAAQSADLLETGSYSELTGGAALAARILFQLLPGRLEDPFDTGNVLVFAAGMLTGTGLPGSCALTAAAVSPLTGAPVFIELDGRLGPQLKQAGYDALVLTGAASAPVWVNIIDDKVKMESAAFLWGTGTRDTTAQICATAGSAAAVAAIGPAGENGIRAASIVCAGGFAADGLGGVMGSKNLKAIAVQGSRALDVADPKALWDKGTEVCKTAVTVPGGSVVPAASQSWSSAADPQSWWNARPGLKWGAADGAPETGECAPGDTARMGLRCLPAVRDFGDQAADSLVRVAACPSCPVGCINMLHLPALERAGLSPYVLCSCEALRAADGFLPSGGQAGASASSGQEEPTPDQSSGSSSDQSSSSGDESAVADALEATSDDLYTFSRLEAAAAAASLAEDFGVGLLGGQLARDFRYAVESGALEAALPESEFAAFNWDRYKLGDPGFLTDVFRRIALDKGEFAALGSGKAASRWNFGDGYQSAGYAPVSGGRTFLDCGSLRGAADAALAAASYDELRQPLARLLGCGLPADTIGQLASGLCGQDAAVDTADDGTVGSSSGALAAWSALQTDLCSAAGLCGRLWPAAATPDQSAGYAGAPDLPAQLIGLALGQDAPSQQLQDEALSGLCLARVLACVGAGTANPAADLDKTEPWVTGGEGIPSAALQQALADLYQTLGWDSSGLPTSSTLNGLYLDDAAEALSKL